jgi:hypothetical protein
MFIEALTLREVVAEVPHDAASLLVYLLVLIAVVAVVRGSRSGRRAGESGADSLPHG